MAKTCQLFSGSSGNSIYIGMNDGGYLVDIGVSAKRCENALKNIGVEPSSIKGIFVTHEHSDHIKGIRVFASRYKIPVYAQADTLNEMVSSGCVNEKVIANELWDNSALELENAIVEPFTNSHDSVSCLGYKFTMPDGRKISVCTDTGYVTDDARQKLLGSDLVFLESNHEPSMLLNGMYPYSLKQRIMSKTGHLSNEDAGEFAKELLNSGTTRFVLSHLSRENNLPSIARQTTISALSEINAKEVEDYLLYVAQQENSKGAIIL